MKNLIKIVKRQMERNIKKAGLRHIIDFGKYKGNTVKKILAEDPSYLVWAHDNTDRLKLRKDIYIEANDLSEEIEAERNEYYGGLSLGDLQF